MRIRVASDQVRKLRAALVKAHANEIGGQLFGEQIAPSDFRVTDVTVQTQHGTFARFVVDLLQAMRDATKFFSRTNHHYKQFNYIGEWHSHPSFSGHPSGTDSETMRQLVCDPEFRGNFAVLMIVRVDAEVLTSAAWLYEPDCTTQTITLELEDE